MKINSPPDDWEGESHEWKGINSKKCALKDKESFTVLADVNFELLKLLFRISLSNMKKLRCFKFKSLDTGTKHAGLFKNQDHVSAESYKGKNYSRKNYADPEQPSSLNFSNKATYVINAKNTQISKARWYLKYWTRINSWESRKLGQGFKKALVWKTVLSCRDPQITVTVTLHIRFRTRHTRAAHCILRIAPDIFPFIATERFKKVFQPTSQVSRALLVFFFLKKTFLKRLSRENSKKQTFI